MPTRSPAEEPMPTSSEADDVLAVVRSGFGHGQSKAETEDGVPLSSSEILSGSEVLSSSEILSNSGLLPDSGLSNDSGQRSEAEPTHDAVLALFLGGVGERFGSDRDMWKKPGTTVVGLKDRIGSRSCSLYRLGAHSLLLTGDDSVDQFDAVVSDSVSVTRSELEAVLSDRALQHVGTGSDHVLSASQGSADLRRAADLGPNVSNMERLDPTAKATIDAVRELFEPCSDDDLEEAEFELDDLDPYLFAWLEDNRIIALAGARPFDERPPFYDIGVLVRPSGRKQGLGRVVAGATAAAVLDDDRFPLYRCDAQNLGSKRIAVSLGFSEAARVDAFCWH